MIGRGFSDVTMILLNTLFYHFNFGSLSDADGEFKGFDLSEIDGTCFVMQTASV